MKCLKCNSEITENNLMCPGCGTSVEELKNNNLIQNNVQGTYNQMEGNVVNQEYVHQAENTTILNNSIPNNEINLGNNVSVGMKENSNNNLPKKSKTPFVVASLLILVLLGVIGVCGYLFINSPKKMFVKAIDSVYASYKDLYKMEVVNANSVSTEFDISGNVKLEDTSMSSIADIINKINLSGNVGIDYQNKTIAVDIDSKYDSERLVNVNAYLQNEKIYVLLKDIYEKYITEDVQGINKIFENDNLLDDVNIISDALINSFNESLKDEYFITEKTTMTINGNNTKVNKITMLLNYENTKMLANDILKILESNEQFLTSLANLTEMEKSEILEELQDTRESINSSDSSTFDDVNVIVYTKGLVGEFVGVEITSSDVTMSIINDKENVYSLLFKEGEDEITGTLEMTDNKYNIIINYDEYIVNITIDIANDNKVNLTASMKMEGNEFTINMSYLTKYNEKITIPNLSNSIDYDMITDEEEQNILTKLMESKGVNKLLEDSELLSMMEQAQDDYCYGENCISQDDYFDESYTVDSYSIDTEFEY